MTRREQVVAQLDIPAEAWRDVSRDYNDEDDPAPPGTVLIAAAVLYGCGMHVNAIRVAPIENGGEQLAAHPSAQDELEKWFGVYDYAFETCEIPGYEGEYVVLVHAYGD
jgi:hypothetical protein